MTKRKTSTPRDYKVGYRKPPVHTRFQKGGPSPNPAGRRSKKAKDQDDLATIFRRVMEETVRVKVGDQVVTMSGWEGAIRKMRDSAFEGDHRALRNLLLIGRELRCLEPIRQALGGVLLIPKYESDADWERQAYEQQAKYRSNAVDRKDEDGDPEGS